MAVPEKNGQGCTSDLALRSHRVIDLVSLLGRDGARRIFAGLGSSAVILHTLARPGGGSDVYSFVSFLEPFDRWLRISVETEHCSYP